MGSPGSLDTSSSKAIGKHTLTDDDLSKDSHSQTKINRVLAINKTDRYLFHVRLEGRALELYRKIRATGRRLPRGLMKQTVNMAIAKELEIVAKARGLE
jgi:hypothetical protein